MNEAIDLKILPEYFKAQIDGSKNFEIRKNDRNFKVGQCLCLKEWDGKKYTNNEVYVEITFVTDYMQRPGYVVLGTKQIDAEPLSSKALQMALDSLGYTNIGDVPDDKLDEVYDLAVDLDD